MWNDQGSQDIGFNECPHVLLTAGMAFGADEPIKLGVVLRLGVGADDGIPARRGVEMAVDEFEQARRPQWPQSRTHRGG